MLERYEPSAGVAGHGEDRMEQHPGRRAELMEIFEHAVNDERSIAHRDLHDGHGLAVKAASYAHRDRLDPEREEIEGARGDREQSIGAEALGQLG